MHQIPLACFGAKCAHTVADGIVGRMGEGRRRGISPGLDVDEPTLAYLPVIKSQQSNVICPGATIEKF